MDVSKLTASAAKLLLHLLLNPGESRASGAQMAAIGTKDKASYYAAKRLLREAGFTDEGGNHTVGGMETLPARYENPTPGMKTLPDEYENPTPPGGENIPRYEIPTHTGMETLPDETLSLRTRIAEADEMDDSGDTQQRNTPFQVRRRAQMPLIAEALRAVMGYKHDVGEGMLKELLVLTNNNASAVLDAIEVTAMRQTEKGQELPLGFVKAVIKRNNERAAPGPSTTRPVSLGAVQDDSPPPPSAEYLAWQQRAKAGLIQAGKAKPADYVRENLV